MITSCCTQRPSTRLIWFVYPSKRYQLAETDEAYEAEMTNYAAESEYGSAMPIKALGHSVKKGLSTH